MQEIVGAQFAEPIAKLPPSHPDRLTALRSPLAAGRCADPGLSSVRSPIAERNGCASS